MLDEIQFRQHSDRALETLKQAIIAAEDHGGFEFEDNNGVMNILFENGSSKFVVTPNTPVRQVWISAQATSFKLEWSDAGQDVCAATDRRAADSADGAAAAGASGRSGDSGSPERESGDVATRIQKEKKQGR